MSEFVCSVRDLSVDFKIKRKPFAKADNLSALRNINIEIQKGEIFGLVGESGCGKTTLANAILGFVPIKSGNIVINGITLNTSSKRKDWYSARSGIQMIFQDPYGSLNSRFEVWQLISEPMYIAGERSVSVLKDRAKELLEKVGLSVKDSERNIFEFSGGQRQRIAIARALSVNPYFIVCDEPTSALDVSVHSQICNLLLDLQQQYELTYLFITHNLGLVRHITNHIAVMYLGQIMESGTTSEIFDQPQHPYTEALLSAIPEIVPDKDRKRIILNGEIISPINADNTCRFAPRCINCSQKCLETDIEKTMVTPEHFTYCINHK